MNPPRGPNKGKKVNMPNKLNAFRRPVIVEGIRAGLTKELVSKRAGISAATLHSWLKIGREAREAGKKPWPWNPKDGMWERGKSDVYSKELDLLEAMDRAEADRLTEALLEIRKAGKGGEAVATEEVTERLPDGSVRTTRKTRLTQPDWKAFAWIAERTSREYTSRQEVSGPDGGPVQVGSLLDLVNKAAEDEARDIAAIKKAGGGE